VDGAGLALDLAGGAGIPVVEVRKQGPWGHGALASVVEAHGHVLAGQGRDGGSLTAHQACVTL